MASLEDSMKWNRNVSKTADPLEFYRTHYSGMTRGELSKKDHRLYDKLRKKGLLKQVPALRERAEVKDFGKDLIAYYREHYLGMTRGQLCKADRCLYGRLLRTGLIEHVPVLSRLGINPVAYYNEHYAGLTRGRLRRQDPSLYQTLWHAGLLKHVPTLRDVPKKSSIDQKVTLVEEFGQKLREIRKEYRVSQEALAKKSGIHCCTIGRIERGTFNPTFETAEKLTEVFGLSLVEVLSYNLNNCSSQANENQWLHSSPLAEKIDMRIKYLQEHSPESLNAVDSMLEQLVKLTAGKESVHKS